MMACQDKERTSQKIRLVKTTRRRQDTAKDAPTRSGIFTTDGKEITQMRIQIIDTVR